MYPHHIRLRGPWEAMIDAPDRVDLPAGWPTLVKTAAGRPVQLGRNFGMMRRLDVFEQVWLVVENFQGNATLNGVEVGTTPGRRLVTPHLRSRNRLELFAKQLGMEPPQVYLEILGKWYLQEATLDRLQFAARLIGPLANNLELYILSHGRTVVYQPVQPGPIDICIPPPPYDGPANPAAAAWRVELIEASNKWHAIDFSV